MNTPTQTTIPTRPSESVAAISLSEDGADRPYVTIFYSVVGGRIHFFALEVTGTEQLEEDKIVVYGDTTNPDEAEPIISGILYTNGNMELTPPEVFMLRDKSQALTFLSVLRAIYQMQEQLPS